MAVAEKTNLDDATREELIRKLAIEYAERTRETSVNQLDEDELRAARRELIAGLGAPLADEAQAKQPRADEHRQTEQKPTAKK